MTAKFDPRVAVADMHGVFGAGGSKAITLGTGAILAYHVLDLTKWKSLGCASGGFVPAVLFAARMHPQEFLSHVVETDFQGLLDARTGMLGQFIAVVRKLHYEKTRPILGAFATDRFGDFVAKVVGDWPDPLWVVTSCSDGQMLMTKRGVYRYRFAANGLLGDEAQLVASTPPGVKVAAQATSAIPGLLDAMPYAGGYLVDGALAGDGDAPIGVVRRHFGDPKEQVIAVDVGELNVKQSFWLKLLFSIGCGGKCPAPAGRLADDNEALVVIRPAVEGFRSLEFKLTSEQKWKAVVAGFVATVQAMVRLGLAPEDTKARALEYALDLSTIVAKHEALGDPSCQVEAYLAERGLYKGPSCAK